MAAGLVDAGLMKGDPAEAVQAGAHALFFPHGLGHFLGLDVHDMEDLGDIGYPRGEARSKQFGLGFLRLAKRLEAGFVLTVEPGIYFIPALIDQWRAAGKHRDFINYPKLASYRDFGGIRIEDDVLVTPKGARVLEPVIPKSVREVEACTRSRIG
jgi:Xaa-Pro aminopeptidase